MAAYSCVQTIHKTLVGSASDAVTITGQWAYVEVLNRAGAQPIYFTNDGSAANNAGPETFVVPAGSALKVRTSDSAGSEVITVVGNDNSYSVMGTND